MYSTIKKMEDYLETISLENFDIKVNYFLENGDINNLKILLAFKNIEDNKNKKKYISYINNLKSLDEIIKKNETRNNDDE